MRCQLVVLAALALLVTSAPGSLAAPLEILRDGASGRMYGIKVTPPRSDKSTAIVTPLEPVRAEQARAAADSFIGAHRELIGLTDPARQLKLAQEVQDQGHHLRYEQTHLGLPVVGAEVVVHLDVNGAVTSATTKVAGGLPTSVNPKITQSSARNLAVLVAQEEIGTTTNLITTSPQLQLLALDIIRDQKEPDTRLVYKIRVYDATSQGELYSKDFFVDANSGEVVLNISNHEGVNRNIYDCAKTNGSLSCVIDSQNLTWTWYYHGRSEPAPVRGPHPNYTMPYYYGSTEVDTLYDLLGALHTFVQISFGLNGSNNQGGSAFGAISPTLTRGFAHVDPAVTYCPNSAAFNNTNGNVNCCRGMVVPDVVGHEYGHGMAFLSRTDINGLPGGYVYSGETGSLVEAFADIHGESFEHYYTGSNDWLVGATAYSGTFRNLIDPGVRISVTHGLPYPNRYYDAGVYCGDDPNGIYINSTVISHAFYLLAEGGELNGCEIEAQGIEEAKQIFTKAWRGLYLPSTATFNEAYTAFRAACADRFASEGGYAHPTCVALTTALQAAELDQPGHCSGIPEVAPPCAVNHAGTAVTTRSNGSPISTFPVGDEIWLSLSGATANQPLDFHLLPHLASRPIWQETTPLAIDTASGTVLPDSTLFTLFGVAMTEGNYDVMIDGNRDGHYQPWADTILPITITPAASGVGDGTRPAVTALKAVQPNPTRDGANVAFSLANPTDISLRVYDVAGRLVRTVASESLPAGTHVRAWDGRDDNGLPTKAGLYFVKFVAGSTVDSRKLVRTQ